jgi:hypothetical protein
MIEKKKATLVPSVLFGMFFLELLFVFVKKIDGTLYGVFDAFEKLYPIIAIMLLTAFMKPKLNIHWWLALGFYTLYLLYGMLISLAQQKGFKIILVQLYHELKFFPMMMLFSLVRCDERWIKLTINIIKPIIIVTVLLILFQLAVPGLYDSIFKNGGHFEKGHFAGMLVPRLVGWFWHPGQVALFFTITTVFLISEHKRQKVKLIFPMVLISVLFVVMAIQRFELFILMIVLTIFWICRYINIDYRRYLALIILLFFGCGILYVISDKAHFWWLLEKFDSPRIIFLVEGLFSLVESNYWGAGWGTIGSHAAADVANVYEYNEMKDFWWVKLGQYFYDTYWPHVIGETGLPGFFFVLFSMIFMVLGLERPGASMLMFILIMTSALSSNAQALYHLSVFGWFIMLLESTHCIKNPTLISAQKCTGAG